MEMYIKDQPAEYVSMYAINLRNPQDKKDEGTGLMEKMLYSESVFSFKDKLYKEYLSKDPGQAIDLITNDKAMRLYLDMANTYNTKIAARLNPIQNRINQLQRIYMQAQMEVMKEKTFLSRCQQYAPADLWKRKGLPGQGCGKV